MAGSGDVPCELDGRLEWLFWLDQPVPSDEQLRAVMPKSATESQIRERLDELPRQRDKRKRQMEEARERFLGEYWPSAKEAIDHERESGSISLKQAEGLGGAIVESFLRLLQQEAVNRETRPTKKSDRHRIGAKAKRTGLAVDTRLRSIAHQAHSGVRLPDQRARMRSCNSVLVRRGWEVLEPTGSIRNSTTRLLESLNFAVYGDNSTDVENLLKKEKRPNPSK